MRMLLLLVSGLTLSGCSVLFPSRTQQSCDAASHALRVHDSRIDAARASGAAGFTATLASRNYQTYHCVSTRHGQLACSAAAKTGAEVPASAQINRLMRERALIETRVARACQM